MWWGWDGMRRDGRPETADCRPKAAGREGLGRMIGRGGSEERGFGQNDLGAHEVEPSVHFRAQQNDWEREREKRFRQND